MSSKYTLLGWDDRRPPPRQPINVRMPQNGRSKGLNNDPDIPICTYRKPLAMERTTRRKRVQGGGMDRLNIPLGSLVLTLLCGIHSRSALGITSSSGGNSSQNPTTSPTSLPLTVSRTSIKTEWFHVPSSIGYSSPFVSLSPISVSISLQD